MLLAADLDRRIKQSKELARAGDRPAALDLASSLVAAHPGELRVWLLRAYIHELEESYLEAESDLSRAITVNGSEPHAFYTRGRMRYELGRYSEAGADFNEGLQLCDLHKNDYYRSELHFWLGAVYLELGDKPAALSVLTLLPDDFSSFIHGVWTKQSMLNRCT
jgi:tetratricopeptide (TPR) repeat protein